MQDEILKLFLENGFLVDKEMLNFLDELQDKSLAEEIINKIGVLSKEKVITKKLIINNLDKFKPVFFELDHKKKKIVEKYFINISLSLEVKKETNYEEFSKNEPERLNNELKKEIINNLENETKSLKKNDLTNEQLKKLSDEKRKSIKVLSSPVISSQKLDVKNFVKHFRNRYNFFKKILQAKSELEGLTSIDKISGNRNFSLIGLVNTKSITKNKNILLEIEDLTGRVKVLINQNKEEVYEKAKEIVVDDVIGFKCSGTRDFVFVNDLYYPEAVLPEKKRLDEEVYVVFISDIHIGSGNFLEKNFERFIDWLNGKGLNEKQKEMVEKIRYIFIVGDSIDGVGIYPGQEKDLKIKDIKEQYVKLAGYLDKIPKYIQIIQCPGQHDAVRVAEPQPPIDEDFAEPLHKLENWNPVSNPSLIEIEGSENKEGFKILMYHGASMHGIINEIEELRLSNAHKTPAKVVKHLLKRRHLAPMHGSTVYIPNKDEDSMIISQIPDIVITGDLHRTDIDMYNNILIVSCSCWQSMTAFEEKVGNQPDPCKVPILNLKSRELKILDFTDVKTNKEKIEKVCKETEKDKKTNIICKQKK